MLFRLFTVVCLLIVSASSVALAEESQSSETSLKNTARWSLELTGGGLPLGGDLRLRADTRVGYLFLPDWEAGLQIGGEYVRFAVAGIESTLALAGLDTRWYPWGLANTWQPYATLGLQTRIASLNTLPIPTLELGVGTHWALTPNWALTGRINVGIPTLLVNPVLGVRYSF